jgi:integrase/recombinase XerD
MPHHRLPAIDTINSTHLLPNDATDSLIIDMWLHGRPEKTQKAYTSDITRLFTFTALGLRQLTLYDLQRFSDSLLHLAESSRARTLSAVKSLLTFATRTGYLPVNTGAALRLPTLQDHLAERIISEAQVHTMLAKEADPRNHAMLRLLYGAGLRVSELCRLTWADVQANGDSGQVTIFGKGNKTRSILLSADTYQELLALRGHAPDTAPVFVSRKGRAHLDPATVNRLVHRAAARAGVKLAGPAKSAVSPHYLRHAHASHALDKGAPVSLVRDTLGHASIATTNKYTHARPNASSSTYLSV